MGGPSRFCQSEASLASLPGEWCAVIGTSDVPYHAACDISYPLYTANMTEISNLFQNARVNHDQFGNELSDMQVWSGSARNCLDWTTNSNSESCMGENKFNDSECRGEIGRVHPDNGELQFHFFNKICSRSLPLICVNTSG